MSWRQTLLHLFGYLLLALGICTEIYFLQAGVQSPISNKSKASAVLIFQELSSPGNTLICDQLLLSRFSESPQGRVYDPAAPRIYQADPTGKTVEIHLAEGNYLESYSCTGVGLTITVEPGEIKVVGDKIETISRATITYVP